MRRTHVCPVPRYCFRVKWGWKFYRLKSRLLHCPRQSLDGYRCRFYRWHKGECEIGGGLSAPYPLEKWNAVLRRRMQRGFEAELAEWKAGA